ncbi:MAG: DUF433 domain-containing protein, partial [Verrucomicrobiota bacterium]
CSGALTAWRSAADMRPSRCDGCGPDAYERLAIHARCASVSAMPATTYRYLTSLPGVRSGRTIIEGTRLGVHDVVGLVVNGATVDEVCRSFPAVTRAQVYECLAYYEDHRAEVDDLVAAQMHDPRA